MDMMIVSRPESPAIIMITQETPEYDAQLVISKTVFQKDIEDTIKQFLKKYQIDTISTYGPHDFIQHISDNIERKFNYTVKQIESYC